MPMKPPASANPATPSAERRLLPTERTRSAPANRDQTQHPEDMITNPMNMRMRSSGIDPEQRDAPPRPITGNSTATRPSVACRSRRTLRPSARRRRTTPTAPRAPSTMRSMPSASRANGDRICTAGARCGPWAPALGRWALRRTRLPTGRLDARDDERRDGKSSSPWGLSLTVLAPLQANDLGSSSTRRTTSIHDDGRHRLALRHLVEVAAQRAPDVLLQRRGVGDVRVGGLADRGDHPRTGLFEDVLAGFLVARSHG